MITNVSIVQPVIMIANGENNDISPRGHHSHLKQTLKLPLYNRQLKLLSTNRNDPKIKIKGTKKANLVASNTKMPLPPMGSSSSTPYYNLSTRGNYDLGGVGWVQCQLELGNVSRRLTSCGERQTATLTANLYPGSKPPPEKLSPISCSAVQ